MQQSPLGLCALERRLAPSRPTSTDPSPCGFLSCSLLLPHLHLGFFFPAFGFPTGIWGSGCSSEEEAAAGSAVQLERRLCFVIGKESGEPGRLFPIASPWQRAFQTHARRQRGRGGRSIAAPPPQPQTCAHGALPAGLASSWGAHPKTASKIIMAGQRNASLLPAVVAQYPETQPRQNSSWPVMIFAHINARHLKNLVSQHPVKPNSTSLPRGKPGASDLVKHRS